MTTKRETALVEENSQLLQTVEFFVERLAELELSLDDTGWIQMTIDGQTEFSNAGLSKIITLARLAYLKNPLINRAVSVQAHYVFGQGMNVEATPKTVDPVVQAFMDHPKNDVELTGHQARTLKEITLQLEANLFLVLFTNSSSGRVVVRKIPVDEILAGDIITNPEDRREPWLYKRVWTQRTFQVTTGETSVSTMTAYYPDWRYKPEGGERVDFIRDDPVHWDQPVMHVKVGGLDDMRFGVPEVYSALDWAKAVTKDLERYATLRASLARFAWFMAQKSTKGIDAAKKKLGTTLGAGGIGAEDNPPPIAGSMFIGLEGTKPEPIRTAGMTPSPTTAAGSGSWSPPAPGSPRPCSSATPTSAISPRARRSTARPSSR
jgi:hypothetical protein